MFRGQRLALSLGIASWAALAMGGWVAGCSSDDDAGTTGGDSGLPDSQISPEAASVYDSGNKDTGVDAGHDASDASDASDALAAFDAADAAVLEGCAMPAGYTVATDPGATRTVAGPTSVVPTAYSPPCLKITVGQSVTFTGDLTDHPLKASESTGPSPIPTTATGTSVTVTFPNAGVYGFHCLVQAHQPLMKGAIWVTP